MLSTSPCLTLSPSEIHLWCIFDETIQDPVLISQYHQLLNETEKVKQKRFYFATHRHQYLITRAALKCTLSCYGAIDPTTWTFKQNLYGKPEIETPEVLNHIRFNLSHTKGLIIIAITLEKELGVDVEVLKQNADILNIARRYFSKMEVDQLNTLDPHLQLERFYEFWTLKESLIKACGQGLTMPLRDFSFDLTEDKKIVFQSQLPAVQPPNQWFFWRFNPTKHHQASIAIQNCGSLMKDKLIIRKMVPLGGYEEHNCPVTRQTSQHS